MAFFKVSGNKYFGDTFSLYFWSKTFKDPPTISKSSFTHSFNHFSEYLSVLCQTLTVLLQMKPSRDRPIKPTKAA